MYVHVYICEGPCACICECGGQRTTFLRNTVHFFWDGICHSLELTDHSNLAGPILGIFWSMAPSCVVISMCHHTWLYTCGLWRLHWSPSAFEDKYFSMEPHPGPSLGTLKRIHKRYSMDILCLLCLGVNLVAGDGWYQNELALTKMKSTLTLYIGLWTTVTPW